VKPLFFWRRHDHPDEASQAEPPARDGESDVEVVQLDPDQLRQLSGVFAAPRWLRDLGLAAWFLVGVLALFVGLTWALGITSTIVGPVLAAAVVATVASPGVTWLHGRGLPRVAGAGIVLLALVALGVVILLLVLGGIVGQGPQIADQLHAAVDKLQSWAEDLGLNSRAAGKANANVTTDVPATMHTFLKGVAQGISGIASLAFGISFTVFSLFFLLKDGPTLRAWLNRHLGVPWPAAEIITGGVVRAVRRYFLGVSIVAAFNAVVVGLGAVILGVPLAGTIAVVTLVTAYIPFIGAVVAGAFAVLLALGSQGGTVALIMLVIVILANGALQNIVSPLAMGATLSLNPLLILVVTISAGAFFGTLGLVLAAPLTSAAIHISGQLRQARLAAGTAAPAPEPVVIIEQPS
jgi:predicted PurR-regulated permease PerM